MALVGYPDSDSSDDAVDLKSKGPSVKPAFRKVVDRAHPHIIRIAIAEGASSIAPAEEAEPPKKRARLESDTVSGFNALLPAPKRAAAVGGHVVRNGGLRGGVGLKTAATPGFIREESRSKGIAGDGQLEDNEGIYNDNGTDEGSSDRTHAMNEEDRTVLPKFEPKADVPKQGNAMMFKPLSVARNKKKKGPPVAVECDNDGLAIIKASQQQTKPKISLFAAEDTEKYPDSSSLTTEDYQPMIYQTPNPDPEQAYSPIPNHSQPPENHLSPPSAAINTPDPSPSNPQQSLSTIAADLNLSASAKRQLLGRHPPTDQSNIKIVNFSTDQEYAANELMRQAGEQVQHNTVRAIAPGKHSLKQLVNAASSQKDAFEEQFASGRRNKKEAGSRYGW